MVLQASFDSLSFSSAIQKQQDNPFGASAVQPALRSEQVRPDLMADGAKYSMGQFKNVVA
jgi:hypothetical protein